MTQTEKAESFLGFLKMPHAFQRVTRIMHVPNEDRYENDVEHSYLLALVAWYMIDTHKLNLDMSRAVLYALVHDLVEVYAGDTYAFSSDSKLHETQREREEEARERLIAEFPEARSIHGHIKMYEKQSDPESIFIKALDKLMPLATKAEKLSFSEVIDHKRTKIASSLEVTDLLEQIIILINKDKTRFFGELIS